ncbi:hypothetical protein Rt10032_c13g4980 [Rhodotorula toruloides]|uniref:Uncharacterized protein n=1 Tax=Rhodotorula toruloides TaxID=5286 RepID=A0A511KKR9_RHOTO|nr:hypothetical protein Rt10032_c13g4980 [Rhodotorula toruloides]
MSAETSITIPGIKVLASQDDTPWLKDSATSNNVGGHLRFNSHVNHITDELLTGLLDSRRKQYIGVHISRRSSTGRVSQETVDAFKAGVKQVQTDLAKRKSGLKGHLPVLFAASFDDPALLSKLAKLGWIYIHHGEWPTHARFGAWYPGVLDSVVLSRARGFAGTKESSFCSIAARLVETWNGGLSLVVEA